jgi:hypothetical protein
MNVLQTILIFLLLDGRILIDLITLSQLTGGNLGARYVLQA